MTRFIGRILAVTLAMAMAMVAASAPPAQASHWDWTVTGAPVAACGIGGPTQSFGFNFSQVNMPAGATITGSVVSGPAGLSGTETKSLAPGTGSGSIVFTFTSAATPDPWSFNVALEVQADGETLLLGVKISCASGGYPYSAVQTYKHWAGGVRCGGDGRLDRDACAGPVALYCDGDTLAVWAIDSITGEGSLLLTFSDWPADAPESNTKLASVGSTQLWQLDTGEFQVNADAGEGKTYAFIFNGCPYDGGGYNANIDPNG